MPTDPLRDLAAAHPDLLTRECEWCGGRGGPRSTGIEVGVPLLGCAACLGTGRRLLTLEEALGALPPGWMLWHQPADRPAGAFYAVIHPECGNVAYRLLIELEASRGT